MPGLSTVVALAREKGACCLRRRLALVGAGVVVASPQFAASFEMTYSPSTARSSAGIETLMTWSDPGEPGASLSA